LGTTIVHTEGRFAGRGGLQLFRQSWRPPPEAPPRATLVNVHGLGDHSSLYPTLVEHMVGREIVVHSFDLRGNGRSPGTRGYIEDWWDYREDLARFLDLVRREESGLPLFLAGNSLGGLIVLDYAMLVSEGLRGVAAISTPLGQLGVPSILLALGRVLSRAWPRFSLETGMDLTGLARDPAVAEQILGDPLFHRRGTARLSTEVVRTIARVQASAPSFRLPVLIMHGADDRMVFPEGSRVFAARVGSPDKQLIVYPGGYHALFADLGHERPLADLSGWIEARL
jgi:alpha-beta hydrolase superfamily lysophospholipase